MQDFVFSNKTKIYFGKDQLHHLGEEVSRFGKKVLLVYLRRWLLILLAEIFLLLFLNN